MRLISSSAERKGNQLVLTVPHLIRSPQQPIRASFFIARRCRLRKLQLRMETGLEPRFLILGQILWTEEGTEGPERERDHFNATQHINCVDRIRIQASQPLAPGSFCCAPAGEHGARSDLQQGSLCPAALAVWLPGRNSRLAWARGSWQGPGGAQLGA